MQFILGALIKPWIFQEIKEQRNIDLNSTQRLELLQRYANYGLDHWGSGEKFYNFWFEGKSECNILEFYDFYFDQ